MPDSLPHPPLQRMPPGIWVLGVVSLPMDISSEMIHSLLPLFMVTTLGAGTIAVGIVEGLAESLALVVKVFSGTVSDYLGRRKGLALFGYALGALTKPLFAIAPDIGTLLTARLLDRVGNHQTLLTLGLLVLVAANLVLALNNHWSVILAGVALWGIHMGMTQGLLATMVADVVPTDLRGTAYGAGSRCPSSASL